MKPEIKERIEKINRGQVPEGYKETKLGIIPSKWKIRTIGQLVEDGIIQKPMDGNHGALHPTSKDYVEKGIPFILATDLEGNKLSLSKCKHIKKEVADKLQKGFSVQGDVLLTHKGSVGNTAVVPKLETEYIMLTPQVTYYRVNDRDKLSNYYLYYHFQGETFQRQLKVMSKGATRDYISIVAQNNLEIILPTDIKEQQKIIDILSTWDKAIELKEKLIEQKKEQKKGLMQRLLTGKVRLPGFEGEWKEVRLGDLGDLYQPQTISQSEFLEEGYPVYGANGLIGYYSKYNHENWQIMITCRGSTCGTVNRSVEKSWITGNAMVLNLDNNPSVDKEFIYYLCLNQNFQTIIEGSGQPQITRKPLANFRVYIPDNLEEQKMIAMILSTADKQIELAERELEALKQQKKGLMQLLLTGKVRVKC